MDSEVIGLDPALLGETAGTDEPVRLLSHRPYSAEAAAQVRRMAETIGDSFAAQPEAKSFPLVTASAARMLAASVLAAFPNTAFPATASPGPAIRDRRDARPETLRRAIAFIEAHPAADITVAGIAAACRVSPRAVQLAFRRHLDTTPMAYVRQVRLACAHQDLVNGGPRGDTVTEIAARWGFASPSQFASAYRASYGRTPSSVLRR